MSKVWLYLSKILQLLGDRAHAPLLGLCSCTVLGTYVPQTLYSFQSPILDLAMLLQLTSV